MISSEVQRTLVKSPPELWAEHSDPSALARHLGELVELGELRITRSEPERKVEWEAENTSGTVLIKPSGWGTKVTLSVTRELCVEAPAAEAQESGQSPDGTEQPQDTPPQDTGEAEDPAATVAVEPDAVEPDALEPDAPEPNARTKGVEDTSTGEAPITEDPVAQDATAALVAEELPPAAVEPRLGFFARLFGRRRPAAPAMSLTREHDDRAGGAGGADAAADRGSDEPEPPRPSTAIERLQARYQPQPPPDAAPEPADEAPVPSSVESEPAQEPPTAIELESAQEPPTAAEPPAEPAVDLAAELRAAEEVAAEEVAAEEARAALSAVLDRLGAAHHRPFSRS
jgi:hypothetical protein